MTKLANPLGVAEKLHSLKFTICFSTGTTFNVNTKLSKEKNYIFYILIRAEGIGFMYLSFKKMFNTKFVNLFKTNNSVS